MTVRHMRLTLGLFFLVAGTGLIVVRFAVPEIGARFNETRLLLGGLLALVLAGMNLAKWYAGWMWYQRQATPVRSPLQPDHTAAPERLPEFDFSKSDDKPATGA